MTYRVEFALGAAPQFHDLPEPAQVALIARVVDLAEAPWDGTRVLPGADAAFRETTFDEGRGMLALYVDDTAEAIYMFNIVWLA